NLLGAPPPPPPANVPPLGESGAGGRILTMRERLEQHRVNPVCASCHQKMDPLGFALENFDAIGKFRTTEGNVPIDTSGSLPDGTQLRGPIELREILLSRSDEFAATVSEKLMTYALGRGVEYYDQPAIRKAVRDAARNDYRWSSLVMGIVNSVPF